MTMPQRSENETVFEALLLYQLHTGSLIPKHSVPAFRRGLEAQQEARGISSTRLLELLERGETRCLREIARSLSIPESYFFRDPSGWNALVEDVLPLYFLRTEPVRIWSAGCARGEEPETLAMLLTEHMGTSPNFQILATDVDPDILAAARRGRYTPWSLRALPEEMRRYFEERDGHFHLLREKLRARVEYVHHHLLLESLPPPWCEGPKIDVVLCRNVLIYFHADAVRRVFEIFHDLVAPGGHLLLASTDPWPTSPGWERLHPQEPLFRRRAEAVPEAPRVPRPLPTPDPVVHEVEVREWTPPPPSEAQAEDALVLARHHLGRGDLKQALEELEKGTEQNHDRPDLHYLRGELLLALERTREAAVHLRKALFLEENHASAALGLHRCASKLEDDAGAQRYLRIALRAARELPPEAPAGSGSDLTAAEFLFVLGSEGEKAS